MAQLFELPRRVASGIADGAAAATAPMRSLWPARSVDDWGRDDHLMRALWPAARMRWDVSVGGLAHIPTDHGALLVTNSRRLAMTALYVSWALSEALDRPVRFAGRPDFAPFGSMLRRVGGLLHDREEVLGALRHGELVVLPAATTTHPRHAGVVDHEIVGAAVAASVTVLPVASMSSPFGRAARVEVGAAARGRTRRRGPLAEVELAEAVQRELQTLLDELGGVQTGIAPLDWIGPFEAGGGD